MLVGLALGDVAPAPERRAERGEGVARMGIHGELAAPDPDRTEKGDSEREEGGESSSRPCS